MLCLQPPAHAFTTTIAALGINPASSDSDPQSAPHTRAEARASTLRAFAPAFDARRRRRCVAMSVLCVLLVALIILIPVLLTSGSTSHSSSEEINV